MDYLSRGFIMDANYKFEGITCSACVKLITKAGLKVQGVEDIKIDITTKKGVVKGNFERSDFENKIEGVGYKAINIDNSNKGQTNKNPYFSRLIIGLVTSIPFIFGMLWTWNMDIQMNIELVLAVFSQVFLGFPFYKGAFFSIINKNLNMDVLVVTGTTISFVYSIYAWFSNMHAYFETSVFLLTFVLLGKYIEHSSVQKTNSALRSLQKLQPKVEVKVGDIIEVVPGQAIPGDGVIISGKGTIDSSMMTGESEAENKETGDDVIGSTIVLSGILKIKITSNSNESLLSKIIKIVETAALEKAPIQNIADRVSSIFVPLIMLLSLSTFIVWFVILKSSLETALSFSASVVVIACPCALGLATPTAIVVGIGLASKNQILFKGGAPLQLLASINNIVFDKTGTLTKGIVELDKDGNRTQNVTGDKVRDDAFLTIKELMNNGIRPFMLTGDKKEKAFKIAKELGIPKDKVIADVLPDGKASAIKTLQKTNPKDHFAFVGDGINDAPALSIADLGIAIGEGSDIALESGDIVLITSKLTKIVTAISISRCCLRKVKQNLFLSLFYNIASIPIAAGVFSTFGISLSPSIASLCMALSSISVVGNSLLLNRVRL